MSLSPILTCRHGPGPGPSATATDSKTLSRRRRNRRSAGPSAYFFSLQIQAFVLTRLGALATGNLWQARASGSQPDAGDLPAKGREL